MEQIQPRRTVVLGIDPGRSTGLYSVSIPTVSHVLTLDEFQQHARWLGNAAITLSSSKTVPLSARWGNMAQKLASSIQDVGADLVVLEYPADGMAKWSGGTARGIDFHMGMFFGFALLGCQPHLNYNIALMPVTSSKAKQRTGWMPRVTTHGKGNRKVTHTQDRDTTLRQCREIAHAIGISSDGQRSEDVDALSEHELMALGVLTYYVTHKAPSEWGN